MRPLGIEVVTRLRAPLVTSARDNSEYRDWANAVQTDISGCNVQPFILSEKLAVEINTERDFVKITLRVWAPAGTDILYTDRVLWRGSEWEVLGAKGDWSHIMGPAHHIDFLIRERTG